jgi:hypothetical protein
MDAILKNVLETTLQTRKILYKILDKTPKQLLLKIPDGYRNNIWWNIAHVMVTQQLLVYKRSNLQMRVPQELVDKLVASLRHRLYRAADLREWSYY